MSAEHVYEEIRGAFGLVPTFMKEVPEDRIGAEWELFKLVQGQENHIPMKYRELIGLGIAAVTKCKYCVYFHTQVAKTLGATDAEIEEAVSFAKSNAGWSAYINGTMADWETFKREIDQTCAHMSAQMAASNGAG
jgi:AhpD family alkylhydroperoxidase